MSPSPSANLRLLYIHHLFYSFSLTVFPVLIPPLIYQTFGSVSFFFIWNSVWTIVYLFLFLPLFNLAISLSAVRLFLIIGAGLFAVFLAVCSRITEGNEIAACLYSALLGVAFAVYWFLRHWMISISADFRAIGRQISIFSIIIVANAVIGPSLAGYLAETYSFELALIVIACVTVVSTFPLLLLQPPEDVKQYRIHNLGAVLAEKTPAAVRPAYFWAGMAECFFSYSFPIAFVISIGDVMKLGFLSGGSALAAALLIWLAGLHFDRAKRTQLLGRVTWARFAVIACYPILAFFPSLYLALILETLNRLTERVHATVQEAYLFGISNKVHPTHFQLNKEYALTLGRLAANVTIIVAMASLPPKAMWIFVGLGAFGQLGWLTMKKVDYLFETEQSGAPSPSIIQNATP
ncbi:MAG: hypothetical protein DCC75_08260 [Proteobacteria bacterium]|nr:MAG: hypothetical protein DCC75_08260 [Pseudomonadota bacterium]